MQLVVGEVTSTPAGTCCECGAEVNRTTATQIGQKPEPGDFTLCFVCTSLNVLADDLSIRAPTDEEFVRAASDKDVQEARRFLQSIPEAQRRPPSPESEAEKDTELQAAHARLDRYLKAINDALQATFPTEDGGQYIEEEVGAALAMTAATWCALIERQPGGKPDVVDGFLRVFREMLPAKRRDADAMLAKSIPGYKPPDDDCDCVFCTLRRKMGG